MVSKYKWLLRPFSVLPALLMAVIIFSFSGQDGAASGGLSAKVAAVAYDLITGCGISFAADKAAGIELLQFPIRKLAHMTEYAVLALTIYLPLAVYKINRQLRFLLVPLIAVAYAALDEWHQTFVPGRTGCVTDVFVDAAGILIMTIFLQFLFPKKKKCGKLFT